MLLRLNPNLTFTWGNENGYGTVGVYLKRQDRTFQEAGIDRPTFIMGIPRDYLPEQDQHDETGALVRRSWKSAIRRMWDAGVVLNREYYREITHGWRRHPV